MTKKRTLFSTISLILVIGLVLFPIFGLSKTRQDYVVDFIYSGQDDLFGAFSDSYNDPENDRDIETIGSTRSAIIALSSLDAIELDTFTATDTYCYDQINYGILYNSLENISHSLETLYVLDVEDEGHDLFEDLDREEDVMEYFENRSVTEGDSIGYSSNVGLNATIYSTYLVVKGYYFLDSMDELQVDNVTEFIMNSFNSDGGFKSFPTGAGSSLTSTFYAIQTLNYLNSLDSLSSNITVISEYIDQFYVNDPFLEAHNGGYSYAPLGEIPFATVRATYEAILTLKLLEVSVPNQETTLNWILQNQFIVDGGFTENALEGSERVSSIITTSQVVQMLDVLGNTDLLSEEFGDYKLRWWIVLIIVIVVLGAGITAFILYQRRIKL
ncbi:MAG: prenyltransferase/squalene oxidase repeat-containing protein [Promethearchaeota archaeon]